MADVSLASQDTTHDLTMQPSDSSHLRSGLSLGDLSNEEKNNDGDDNSDNGDNDGIAGGAALAGLTQQLATASHVERKLQSNLHKQQRHYARQRKLLDELRSDDGDGDGDDDRDAPRARASPFLFSSSSRSGSDADMAPVSAQRRRRHHQLDLQQELTGNRLTRQHAGGSRVRTTTETKRHPRVRPMDGRRDRDDPHKPLVAELQEHEASNEALRRQLELLRRLQVDNNRFRQDVRSLREQNAILEEQKQQHKLEIQRLRDDVQELTRKVEHDAAQLSTAAQTTAMTTRKLKQCHKQLQQVQAENDKLEAALQDSVEQQTQQQAKAQTQTHELAHEARQLKRALAKAKAQETKLVEHNKTLQATIASLEGGVAELRTHIGHLERENTELSAQCLDKTKQCEGLEASAAACVERMESGLASLQKAYALERDKRKKADKANAQLQDTVDDLETQLAEAHRQLDDMTEHVRRMQEKLKEYKATHRQSKQTHDDRVDELMADVKQAHQTIATLKDEIDGHKREIEAARGAVVEARKDVSLESSVLRKEIDQLRCYVESALRTPAKGSLSPPSDLDFQNESSMASSDLHHRREEIWVRSPELQYLQGAIGALRNEAMNFVHEFQRVRNGMRQVNNKLTLAQERVQELEHLRCQDAAKLKEVRDQKAISEQAREISTKEKLDVLKWSQQTCERNEVLLGEVKACAAFFHDVLEKLKFRRALNDRQSEKTTTAAVAAASHRAVVHKESRDDDALEEEQFVSSSFPALAKELDVLLTTRDDLSKRVEGLEAECDDKQDKILQLQRELESKMENSRATLAEIEALHERSMGEQKAYLDAAIADLEDQRARLTAQLEAETQRSKQLTLETERLQTLVEGFEDDVPVLATLVHLFVLVAQPMILQISELLAQKRLLLRENIEYAQTQEQLQCLGHVLKELVPPNVTTPGATQEARKLARRRAVRTFRRCVIAVVALNRLRKCGAANGGGDFGQCTPMKASKRRSTTPALSGGGSAGVTVIKALPAKNALARLSLRRLLEHLKATQLTKRFGEWVEGGEASPVPIGAFLMQVVGAIDADALAVVTDNTSGVFHCHSLLERRRISKKRTSGSEVALESAESTATVDFIRQRILTLGKRVEDLHYQRNALQKDNYELQFQLEQQATSLKDKDELVVKCRELEEEMANLRSQTHSSEHTWQEQLVAAEAQTRAKDEELQSVHKNVTRLQVEIEQLKDDLGDMEQAKRRLEQQLEHVEQASHDDEEKAEQVKLALRRQEEDVQHLKQAAKRAHEQFQRLSAQLERELSDKAGLQAQIEALKHQNAQLERELRDEKIRDVEKSFSSDLVSPEAMDDSDDGSVDVPRRPVVPRRKPSTPTKRPKVRIRDSGQDDSERNTLAPTAESPCWYHHRQDVNATRSTSPRLSQSPVRQQRRDDSDAFAREWSRLSASRILADSDKESHTRIPTPGSVSSAASPSTAPKAKENVLPNGDNVRRLLEIQSNRRRIDIDKVNTAVHDYMDRIDEKLHQMYGIPPSTGRERSALERPKEEEMRRVGDSCED
ncbi:TPA: hypothetical protein N0F65_010405 [Lagenidium giganteum]|uniref:Uncharacterized protein n=1 Tax=Lagenidium giganteum TaxID=4803 RepID=A0AAV2YV27_9STRA|nr:TPA: hypothetical protein N0F65_010405 [Lagenidium giganteum]